MRIQVQKQTGDDRLIDGFLRATGWTPTNGITKQDWFVRELNRFVVQKARQGDLMTATATPRTAYTTAARTALADAAANIPEPNTTMA